MQIHELNDFTGALGSGSFLAIDNGNDTGKISTQQLLVDVNAEINALDDSLNGRIDNIIAGGDAPSEAEIIDARHGASDLGGKNYASLGDAIRGQATKLNDKLNVVEQAGVKVWLDWEVGGIDNSGNDYASLYFTRSAMHRFSKGDKISLQSTNGVPRFYLVTYQADGTFISKVGWYSDSQTYSLGDTGVPYVFPNDCYARLLYQEYTTNTDMTPLLPSMNDYVVVTPKDSVSNIVQFIDNNIADADAVLEPFKSYFQKYVSSSHHPQGEGRIEGNIGGMRTYCYHVFKGDKVSFKSAVVNGVSILSVFDLTDTYVKTIYQDESTAKIYEYTATEECYLYISNYATNNPTYTFSYYPFGKMLRDTGFGGVYTLRDSQLFGKKINMIGDSYVANNNDPVSQTWHYKLAQKYGMTYRNYGINGCKFVTTDSPDAVINRYQNMDDDADFVGVVCGHNEMANCGNGITEAAYKTLLRTFFGGLVQKYPTKKIFYVSPWGMGQVSDLPSYQIQGFNNGINWVKDVCAEFNIPMFDCRRSNMYMGNTAFMTAYCQGSADFAHLNNAGHNRFLPTMEQFILGI